MDYPEVRRDSTENFHKEHSRITFRSHREQWIFQLGTILFGHSHSNHQWHLFKISKVDTESSLSSKEGIRENSWRDCWNYFRFSFSYWTQTINIFADCFCEQSAFYYLGGYSLETFKKSNRSLVWIRIYSFEGAILYNWIQDGAFYQKPYCGVQS